MRNTDHDELSNMPIVEDPAAAQARLLASHSKAGTMGAYYLMYPQEAPVRTRPKERDFDRGR